MSFVRDVWANDQLTFWSLAFILAIAITGLALTTVRVWSVTRRLKRAHAVIRHSAESGDALRAVAVQELRTVAGFDTPVAAYGRWWRGALIADRGAALGTKTLEDFLAPTDVLPSWTRALAGTLPGILVALGILGTFIGLVLGLPTIGEAGQMGDVSKFGGFVQTITKSLGLAFWTSILGIASSVIYLIVDKTSVSLLEDTVHRVSRHLSEAFPTLTPEEVQRVQMERLEDLTGCVKNLSVDLAQSLANYMGPAIGQALQAELAPAVREVQNAVSKLTEFATDRQTEAVEALATGFVESMNAALGDQFEQLRIVISRTVESQKEIGDSVQTFAAQLRSTAEGQTALIERTSRLALALNSMVERFEAVVTELNDASDSFGELVSGISASVRTISDSSQRAASVQQALSDRLASDRIAIETARTQLVEAWSDTVTRAQSAIHQITEASRQVGQGVGDQLVNALSTFDSALAEVVQRFSGTLAQVDASVNELPPVTLAIRDTLAGVGVHTEKLSASTAALEQLVREGLVQFGKDSATAAAQLDSAMRTANQSIQGEASVRESFVLAAHGVTESLREFRSGIEALQRAATVAEPSGTSIAATTGKLPAEVVAS